jgi:hypothetical protein
MKRGLRSIQLLPRGSSGWESPELFFAAKTTLVSGPLGSGKTPLLKALAFTLGAAVELPPLVKERCAATCLTVWIEDQVHQIRRLIEPGVVAVATGPDGASYEIGDEKALSQWVLRCLGVPEREFASVQGGPAFSYLSILAPVFLVDQDIGWTAPYVALDAFRFVRNQREEVLRWVLNVPGKHRVVDKSAFEDAKAEHTAIQQQIAFKRRTIEKLTKENGVATESLDTLAGRRSSLHEALRSASTVLESLNRSESALDSRVRESLSRRDAARYQLDILVRRRAQVLAVQGDVQAETEALEQNEIAASAFRALCGSENCKFFRQPEESYGRRLLYLKDQLKDFTLSANQISDEIRRLELDVEASESAVALRLEEKKRALAEVGGTGTIAAVESLTKELTDVSVAIDRAQRLAEERRQLDALINHEARATERVAELKPSGGRRDNARLLDARAHLGKTFNEWVAALRTPNVSADAVVDEDLRILVGGEKFDAKISHSGSTRTRLVLAYHGAVLETSLKMNGFHPPLLVLDAPRQHELSPEDVHLFVERFARVAEGVSPPVQLVLSATDQSVVGKGSETTVWSPSFPVEDGYRYLGRPPPAGGRVSES